MMALVDAGKVAGTGTNANKGIITNSVVTLRCVPATRRASRA